MDGCCTDNSNQWVSLGRFLPFWGEQRIVWFCSLLLHSCIHCIHCIFNFTKWCSSFRIGGSTSKGILFLWELNQHKLHNIKNMEIVWQASARQFCSTNFTHTPWRMPWNFSNPAMGIKGCTRSDGGKNLDLTALLFSNTVIDVAYNVQQDRYIFFVIESCGESIIATCRIDYFHARLYYFSNKL